MQRDIRNEIDISIPAADSRSDNWGEAMAVMFDLVDVLEHEGEDIPHAWGWRHSPGCAGEEAYERFGFAAHHVPMSAFLRAGAVLHRYIGMLEAKGYGY